MRPLLADDLIDVWARGESMHAIDRALLLLRRSCPEVSPEGLATLRLGERDALLLELRRQTFGDGLDVYAECPNCRERLEFVLSCRALAASPGPVAASVKMTIEGAEFTLRPPDSRDAAAIARSASVEEAAQLLAT